MWAMKSPILWLVWLAISLALAREAHGNAPASTADTRQKEGGLAPIEDEPSELEAADKKERGTSKLSKRVGDLADQDTDYDDEDDQDKVPAASASEGSRSVGGAPVDPPHWLTSSWLPQDSKKDNKFAGHMIRLNDNLVLGHQDTCINPLVDWVGSNAGLRFNGEQVTLKSPSTINVKKGSPGDRLVGCSVESADHLAHNFGVFKLTQERGDDSYNHLTDKRHYKGPPALQHDPNVKDNCFLHSYSGNKNPMSHPDDDRVFSKLQVHHNSCTNGMCTFRSKNTLAAPHGSEKAGAVCPHLNDRGAPIMCGQDQKLSYVVAHHPGLECGNSFYALPIADHHKRLMQHVQKKPILASVDHLRDAIHDIKPVFAPGANVPRRFPK